MNINEISESKYLKKEDVQPPLTVKISGIECVNMAQDGEPPENKWILRFVEAVKPMVLNMTNARLIAMVTGSEETDNWIGKQITLYNDPSVSFAGKLTGGIRVQAVANTAPNQPVQAQQLNDDAPF